MGAFSDMPSNQLIPLAPTGWRTWGGLGGGQRGKSRSWKRDKQAHKRRHLTHHGRLSGRNQTNL